MPVTPSTQFSQQLTPDCHSLPQFFLYLVFVFLTLMFFTCVAQLQLSACWPVAAPHEWMPGGHAPAACLHGCRYYGMMITALMPVPELGQIFSAMFYSLWFVFAGFFISQPKMPKWWSWL